jgi:5-(carboxyamino)imidazole ribonucleotide mutase
MKKVAVIMGSDSDLPVVKKAIDTLGEYGVPTEVHVYSATEPQRRPAAFPGTPGQTALAPILPPQAWPRTWPARWPPTPRCPDRFP